MQAAAPVAPPATRRLVGTLAALAATIFFSLNGTLSALAYELGADPLSMSFWRGLSGGMLLVGVIGLLLAVRGRRLFDGRRPTRRAWAWLGIGIVAVTVQNLGIYGAFQETSVLVALVCFYCYPVLIGAVSVVLGLERMDARRGGALVTAFVGCVLVVAGGEDAGGDVALTGAVLAIIAAVGQTVYVLSARHGFGSVPTPETAAVLNLGPAAMLLVLGLLAGNTGIDPANVTGQLALIFVVGAVLGQTVPMLLYLTGVRTIGPVDTAAIALIEPFAGAVVALVVVGQPFGPLQLAGGMLVAGSALLVQQRR